VKHDQQTFRGGSLCSALCSIKHLEKYGTSTRTGAEKKRQKHTKTNKQQDAIDPKPASIQLRV
jgi:hypothetical protein